MKRWTRRLQSDENTTQIKGKWTKALIRPEGLKKWVIRQHGEMSFHVTKLITEHGCFNSFLHRINIEANEVEDNAEHTLMNSKASEHDRQKLISRIGSFKPKDHWNVGVPCVIDSGYGIR